MTWDEYERLRQLVPERADWHLHVWSVWCTHAYGVAGYDRRSKGLATGGISGDDAFDHLCEEVDGYAARVADAVVDGLPVHLRLAIEATYCGGSWRNRPNVLDATLVEAAELFWLRAKRRGLM